MTKKLLMLSAKESDIVFIQTAQRMGYHVITTGYKADRVGNKIADEYVPFDYSDYDGLAKLARELDISAICEGCTDFCAFTAAVVGEKLGFKGHDNLRNTEIIHRKDAFKAFTREYNVKTPLTRGYTSREAAMAELEDKRYPLIVKPADLAGGFGVRVVENEAEYIEAVDYAINWSHIGHIVVEPFIRGTLHSISTFLIDQKVVAFGTANDYSFKNPYLTNTGLFPADDWEKATAIMIPEVERVASILGLVDGLMHLQYIMDENGEPWIIEMMRRRPGNNFTTALSNSTGIDWREWIIRAEAGEDCSDIPRVTKPRGIYGYHSIMASENGVFQGQVVEPELKPFVSEEIHWMQPGSAIENYMADKTGSIQYHFETEEERRRIMPRINELAHAVVSNSDHESEQE